MENNNTPATDRLLEVDEVQVSRSRLYAGMRDGFFPKPIKIGDCFRWKVSVISAFLGGLRV